MNANICISDSTLKYIFVSVERTRNSNYKYTDKQRGHFFGDGYSTVGLVVYN